MEKIIEIKIKRLPDGITTKNAYDANSYIEDGWYYFIEKDNTGWLLKVGKDSNFPQNSVRTVFSIPINLDCDLKNGMVKEIGQEVKHVEVNSLDCQPLLPYSERFLLQLVAVSQKPELIKDSI